jgi:cold shock CspA family protein
MAKSQETFNKKEKEKLKLKKRQEKMNRKEERKANSGDGSLDSMMAYVDEFGNITATPPDPSHKKIKVNASSIELGVPKREEEPEEKVREGKVAFYNSSKGYGFIKDLASQENIFVHINGIIDPIDEGDRVTFEMVRGQKGMNAVHVRKVK